MRILGIILLIFVLQISEFAFCAEEVKTIFVSAAVNNKAVDIKKKI